MKNVPRIAILGGGVGGLVCAIELNYRLGTKAEVTVFDKSPNHIYQPAFLHLALGERKIENISRPLDNLKRQGVNFLYGEVFRIDPKNYVINSENGDFEFDFIILALGAQLEPKVIEGFEDNALNLYTADGAVQISQALNEFNEGKIVIAISSMPYKCPAAPYEMAFLLDSYFSRNKKRKDIKLAIVTPEPQPMPVAGSVVGEQVTKMLDMAEIEYLPNENIKSIAKQINLGKGKKHFSADMVIGIPAHRCPDIAVDAQMAKKDSWIEVDKQHLTTKYENIFAIGDSNIITLVNGKALPKAAVFAKSQGQIVANNLANKINKSDAQPKYFDGHGACFVETGNKKAAYAKGDFYQEPNPLVNIKDPSKLYYYFKMLYEKYWMRAWL